MIIRSISGVRGLTSTHLNTETISAYARAFHKYNDNGLISKTDGLDHAIAKYVTTLKAAQ